LDLFEILIRNDYKLDLVIIVSNPLPDDFGLEPPLFMSKKEAMIVAGKLLSHPEAYRIATQSTEIALKTLPRFAIYNHFNVWGRHREVPAPADETFHEWYRKHRST